MIQKKYNSKEIEKIKDYVSKQDSKEVLVANMGFAREGAFRFSYVFQLNGITYNYNEAKTPILFGLTKTKKSLILSEVEDKGEKISALEKELNIKGNSLN